MRCKRAISDPPMSAAACRRITALASLVPDFNDNRVPARGKSIRELRQAHQELTRLARGPRNLDLQRRLVVL